MQKGELRVTVPFHGGATLHRVPSYSARTGHNYLVRVKTSITPPQDLLKSIDQTNPNRSAFIERAARAYLARLEKAKRDARDVEIINANADRLNAEARDVLEYQRLP